MDRFAEAETEYRMALSMVPQDSEIKLGLAEAFYRQDKRSASLVVLEELVKQANLPAESLLIAARLLHELGEVERSRAVYSQVLDIDPSHVILSGFMKPTSSQ